jgi:hypothetical protein
MEENERYSLKFVTATGFLGKPVLLGGRGGGTSQAASQLLMLAVLRKVFPPPLSHTG